MIRDLDVDGVRDSRRESTPEEKEGLPEASSPRRRKPSEQADWPDLGPERRQHPRLELHIWMMEEAADHLCYRRTADVSEGGAYFDPSIPHPVGTRMQLRIPLPDGEVVIRAQAEVVNLTVDGEGMGVRFLEFEGDGREQLHQFLATQSTEPEEG